MIPAVTNLAGCLCPESAGRTCENPLGGVKLLRPILNQAVGRYLYGQDRRLQGETNHSSGTENQLIKQYFLWTMAVIIPIGILAWFLWTLGKSMVGLVQDKMLDRELDELKNQSLPKPKTDDDHPESKHDYTTRM